MPQLEHIEAIEKRLWTAADTLRANSNYASNEYFLPVMGLVFLRHAYSRYLMVKDKVAAKLPDVRSGFVQVSFHAFRSVVRLQRPSADPQASRFSCVRGAEERAWRARDIGPVGGRG